MTVDAKSVPLIIFGSLKEIPIVDVARLLQGARQTGSLCCIAFNSQGRIYFRNGEIVEAEVSGHFGVDALRVVGLYCRGSFRFDDKAAAPSLGLLMHPTEELIRFLEQQMNDARLLQELIPESTDVPKFIGGTAPEGFEFTQEEISYALQCAEGKLTLKALAIELKVPEPQVAVTIARFRAAGLMQVREKV